jgi:hypothetical protein
MQIGDKQYGVPVAGTFLLKHGRAPRNRAGDRNARSWYQCTRCAERKFKIIRDSRVRSGETISCGCVGRERFKTRFSILAEAVPEPKRRLIFKLARRRRRPLTAKTIAKRFGLEKYTVDFIIAARCAALRALAATRDALRKGLSWLEQCWITKYDRDARRDAKPLAYAAAREAYLDGLHWRDRLVWLAAEKAKICRGPVPDAIRAIINGEIDGEIWCVEDYEFAA